MRSKLNLPVFDNLSVGKQIAFSFGLPLALVSTFALALLNFDHWSYSTEQAEKRKRQALQHLENISVLTGDSFAGLFADSSDEAIANSDHMQEIRSECNRLAESLEGDREYARDLQQLTELLDKQVKTLFYLHSRPGRSVGHILESEEIRGSLASYAELSRAICKRIERETSSMDQYQHARVNASEHIRFLLLTALFASVLTAVISGTFFFLHLQKRLRIVTSNVVDLASGLKGTKLAGDDELSYLNESLIRAFDQLFEAQKKRQEVIQMVTHDLRSPLSAIGASIDNVLRDSPLKYELVAERFTSIKKLTQRMTKITEDFLLLEKLDGQGLTFKRDEIDLRSTVSDCLADLVDKFQEKGISVRNSCGEYLLVTDELRFSQILNNLLTNAIKVSPYGGEIEVSTQQRKDYLQISVFDQGPGIEPTEIVKAFERFYQARNAERTGFGVGLNIVKALVEGQGGTVGVESRVEKGSRFWFTIPYSP